MNALSKAVLHLLTAVVFLAVAPAIAQAPDPLPSWNQSATKAAIVDFVRATTTPGSPQYFPVEERIATFDQDGTLWVEQPVYTQVRFMLEQVPALVRAKPELATQAPYSTVLQILGGDHDALRSLTLKDLEALATATMTGMSVDAFNAEAARWIATAKHPRWDRPYTELVYQPMQELLKYLRDNGFKTFIVTGGGQDFVRAYAEKVYGIPPEQVIGMAYGTTFGYDKSGKPLLTRDPKLLLNDDFGGKPEGIQLMIGRRPAAAIGNSTGDQQMLEYAKAGDRARLAMIVLHDDAKREYSYGPAQGLPDSKIGRFTQALFDEATRNGWVVISMKDDWKRIFAFEQ